MTPDNLISTSCRDAEISLIYEAERRPVETLLLIYETVKKLDRLGIERKSLRRVLSKAARKAWATKKSQMEAE